ncbi:SDR family oxidoreductase [Spirosoma arcticum]
MKRIAVIGATGLLGEPVAHELINAGFTITILARDEAGARKKFGTGATYIVGDLDDEATLTTLLTDQDGLYMNLSVNPDSSESDYQPEREGMQVILDVAKRVGLPRIGYLVGLIQEYQGMDGFDFWPWVIKNQAVASIKQNGIPYFIYHASSFMDNFDRGSLRSDDTIRWAGDSKQRMYFASASDYGKQVANSFKLDVTENREYIIQGPEAYTMDETATIFIDNYPKQKMEYSHAPLPLLQLGGVFSSSMEYVAKLSESMNNYPEQFRAQPTWDELGKPTTTLAEYARHAD